MNETDFEDKFANKAVIGEFAEIHNTFTQQTESAFFQKLAK